MIEEAEQFKAADSEQKAKNAGREELKNYVYQVMDSLESMALVEKITNEDMEKVEETITEAMEWLENNEEVGKDELSAKKKEIEAVVKPVMIKLYADKVKEATGKNNKKSRSRR